MSDTNPITLETQPVKTPTEQILKSSQENIKKQTNLFDERPVILTIENPQKPDKPESAGVQKKSENLKIFKDVRTVSVSYSEQGLPVVKFLDSKGNTVLQIPPEEYLRLKEETKAKSGEKIPDIVNKKI